VESSAKVSSFGQLGSAAKIGPTDSMDIRRADSNKSKDVKREESARRTYGMETS
jgi:hypothetical protein